MNRWNQFADQVLSGRPISPEQAMDVLRSPEDELLAVIQAAYRLRNAHHGRKVKLQVLNNAKSGGCLEDCSFCSQSLQHQTQVPRTKLKNAEAIFSAGEQAHRAGARTYCMVMACSRPHEAELRVVTEAARRLKERFPKLHLCASLGFLAPQQAQALVASGVDRYNHNLETSRRYFPQMVTSHTYQDRLDTLLAAQSSGLELCCGGIVGAGETDQDRVDLAFAIRELGAKAVPVNFLDPRPETPLAARPRPQPRDCLRTLAMFRFVHPGRELRAAGGREVCLRSLQPLALYVVDSIFTAGYLTTSGQGQSADVAMIEDAGFCVSVE